MTFGHNWIKSIMEKDNVHIVPWPILRDIAIGQGLIQTLNYIQDPATNKYYVTLEMSAFWTFLSTFDQRHSFGVEFESVYKLRLVKPITPVGLPSFTPIDVPNSASNYRKSWQYDVPPNALSIYDVRVGNDLTGPSGLCYLRGGECEVDGFAEKGSYLSFSIVDRDDVIGRFGPMGYSRCRLTALTSIVNTFTAGNIIVGDTSGASATILSVDNSYLDIRANFSGVFLDGEGLTEKDSNNVSTGTTAILGSFIEGDVDELVRSIDNEQLRTDKEKDMTPGGSRKLFPGLYIRTQVWNQSLSNYIDLTITLKMARE